MLDNKDSILSRLKKLGLKKDEAHVYQELLDGPTTHLKLSRATGINRTKIYRIVDELEKRSLISIRSDDRGTFLIASDPSTLEIDLIAQEERLKSQRQAFAGLMPLLTSKHKNDASGFVVHTYEGEEGFKQMLWHELKAKKELLLFGSGTPYDLVSSSRWGQKYQLRALESGYGIRVISNPSELHKMHEMDNKDREEYAFRIISEDILPLENQISIYNNTIAIYHWRTKNKKTGVEIINKQQADTMRSVFELAWSAAGKH